MNVNHSSQQAKSRSDAGMSRRLKVFRTKNNIHPKNGGSHGYPLWFRIKVIDHVYAFGVNDATAQFNVSKKSVRRWLRRIVPYHQTGNHERTNIVGRDQLLLSICLHVYPRAKDLEIAAFIYANGGNIYSKQDVSKRCKELKLTKKRVSLESNSAYTERNLIRARQFWTMGPRIGVNGVPRHRLIDIDEASFCLKKIEKKYGRAYSSCRVRDLGNYKRGGGTISLLMAVEPGNPNLPPNQLGSIEFPRVWYKIVTGSVDQFVYANFIDHICTDIEQHPLPHDNERYFLWDNLALHGTAYVNYKLEMRPSRHEFQFVAIPRPPYQPKFAPIEYVFCQIANELSNKTQENDTMLHLRTNLTDLCTIIGNGGRMDRTFSHCGYE